MKQVKFWLSQAQQLSIPLILGVVTALLWVNLSPESYFHLMYLSPFQGASHGLMPFLTNDILMVFFFGIATKEITEACLPGGALNPVKKALNPLAGTLGGVLGPIFVYKTYVWLGGHYEISAGWGIPTATDIALAWLVAKLAFGPKHPAVSFLLLLAVADDGIGLAIIAIAYPDPLHPVQFGYCLLVGVGMLIAFAMRKGGVKSHWTYLALPGVLSWAGLYLAHLHPALALVPIIPFMPSAGKDEGMFAEEDLHHEGHKFSDTLNAFEHAFKFPVDFGLFFFGLANAGVQFSSMGPATTGVLFSLLIGKTLGIFSFSMVATRLGAQLPSGMDWRSLLVAGIVAGLGLTVALFVAGVAFTSPSLQGAAKMGALFSAVAAPMAFVTARLLKIKRVHETEVSVVLSTSTEAEAEIVPS